MTLHPIKSEFPQIWGKFSFLFISVYYINIISQEKFFNCSFREQMYYVVVLFIKNKKICLCKVSFSRLKHFPQFCGHQALVGFPGSIIIALPANCNNPFWFSNTIRKWTTYVYQYSIADSSLTFKQDQVGNCLACNRKKKTVRCRSY